MEWRASAERGQIREAYGAVILSDILESVKDHCLIHGEHSSPEFHRKLCFLMKRQWLVEILQKARLSEDLGNLSFLKLVNP